MHDTIPRLNGFAQLFSQIIQISRETWDLLKTGKSSKRSQHLRALVTNILEFLREETDPPWSRNTFGATAVLGNYCELLWENAVDEAFGRYGDPEKYEEWQWLELRRSITELALGFREGARSGYGWKA